MPKKKYRRYSPEFKRHALKRSSALVRRTLYCTARAANPLEPVDLESGSRVAPHHRPSCRLVDVVARLRHRYRDNAHVAYCEEAEPYRPARPFTAGSTGKSQNS